jgi:hypothetical protein
MESLEHYLDQVCRGIAGPREMRLHIRQELREHLLDAVAEHRAAGLSEDAALAKALEDFGGPQEVRSELEAQHGHRMMMALVIDKALEWKEKTMKAKWLWTTWAHLALGGVILAQAVFMWWLLFRVAPTYDKVKSDGKLGTPSGYEDVMSWNDSVVARTCRLAYWFDQNIWLWLPLLAVAIGLFEWRVRSENKSLIRLSALGTGALALMAPVALASGALVVQFILALSSMHNQPPEPRVRESLATVESSLAALDQAIARKDWGEIDKQSLRMTAIWKLSGRGAAAPTLLTINDQAKIDQLRTELKSAGDAFVDIQSAVESKDEGKLQQGTKQFHDAFDPVQKTAKGQ